MSEEQKTPRNIKKSKHYLSNKEMYDEVIKSQEQGAVTDKLARQFMLLAQRYTNHRFFVRLPDHIKEEMVQEGVLYCIKGLHKFDPERTSNPFAYYTSVLHNAFIQYSRKEYDQKNVKDQIMVENNMNPSWGYEEANGYDNTDEGE